MAFRPAPGPSIRTHPRRLRHTHAPEHTWYDLLGNLRRTDLPNGVITENAFDELNRLDVMTHYAPDATPADLADNNKLAEFDYSVRADGKRTSATETYWLDADQNAATPATPHVNQINWTYDDIGRLTDEIFNHFDDARDQTEHFVHDLVGNRLEWTKDRGNNASIDEAITYSYDANDRLIDELLDANNDGQTDQTTTYGWTATQQTSKTVVDNTTSQTTSIIMFSFDVQGRMAEVVTETRAGGVMSRRERVTYDYDATGIRVSALREVDANADGSYESTSRTEFLVDHQNFTGYQQVLKETSYDGQGNIVKTVEYTIGHDEVAQIGTEYDAQGNVTSEATHVFGHDGHGSARALFNMAAAVLQIYTFDAFGQLMAIHNGFSQFVGNSAAQALTSVLQNGEQFDARISQLYLRARWYDPQTGRFNRLDPFSGNFSDPLSLHKYLFVHANPITNIDPTGKFSLGSISVSLSMSINLHLPTVVQGSLIALTLSTIGDVGGRLRRAGQAMLAAGDFDRGMMLYAMGTRILSAGLGTAETIANVMGAFDIALAAIGITRAVIGIARARVSAGGGGLAFHAVHWIDDVSDSWKPIQQTGKLDCGQTCAMAILSESGIDQLTQIFKHNDATDAAELAAFLKANGMAGVNSGSVSFPQIIKSVENGRPAIVLIRNIDGDPHWVIIDDVLSQPGQMLIAIRDPSSGKTGWMKDSDFILNYFGSVGVWFD